MLISSEINSNQGEILINAETYGGSISNYYLGQIDEIRIYNRTLSDQEIKTLYWYSIKPLEEGLNKIDLSSCNLNKNNIYSIFTKTESGKNLNYNFVSK